MHRSILRSILRFLFNIFTRLEVHNQENIPLEGPVLLAHNHLSRLDAPLVFMLLLRD